MKLMKFAAMTAAVMMIPAVFATTTAPKTTATAPKATAAKAKSATEEKAKITALNLKKEDSGKEFTVVPGQEIVVALSGNPTTGYSWEIAEGKTDAKILKQIKTGDEYVAGKSNGMAGAGGTFYFRYQAEKEGNTQVVLQYKRPWEKDTDPAETFTAKIKVKKAADIKADTKKEEAKKVDKTDDDMQTATIYTVKNSGEKIKIKKNSKFVVKLSGNPTTGYSWYAAEKVTDSKVLLLEGGEGRYIINDHKEGMVGAGGNFYFDFTAKQEGITNIRLEYKRPWEKDTEPIQKFELNVTVE